jgi:hypothetical protein
MSSVAKPPAIEVNSGGLSRAPMRKRRWQKCEVFCPQALVGYVGVVFHIASRCSREQERSATPRCCRSFALECSRSQILGAVNDADARVLGLQNGKMKSAASSSSTYNEAVLIRAELRLEKLHFKVELRTKPNLSLHNVGASNLIILQSKIVSSSLQGDLLIRNVFVSWNDGSGNPRAK